MIVQLDEVRPDHAPGARGVEGAVLVPDKPFGMVGEELGGPAGVVDGDVDEEPGAPGMDAVRQFAELLERGGAAVEFGEGGVHVVKIQRGKRAAVAAHSGMGGGDGEGRAGAGRCGSPCRR